ncbi:uncharacterized protein DUF3140 [Sphingomonas sp. F9_3S_D5_B_2]
MSEAQVRAAFHTCVNMSAPELQEWLDTDDSRRVGQKKTGNESIGHASGRHILAILGTPEAELSAEDIAHMRKVVGFIRRHRAQEPANIVTSRWRYSLMNWGHDPLKELA